MKTKFIKVSVEERLPEENKKVIIIDENSNVCEGHISPNKTWFANTEYEFYGAEFWLEEVPDREDEMREMLEKIYNIENEEFCKPEFNIEDLKRKIKRIIND